MECWDDTIDCTLTGSGDETVRAANALIANREGDKDMTKKWWFVVSTVVTLVTLAIGWIFVSVTFRIPSGLDTVDRGVETVGKNVTKLTGRVANLEDFHPSSRPLSASLDEKIESIQKAQTQMTVAIAQEAKRNKQIQAELISQTKVQLVAAELDRGKLKAELAALRETNAILQTEADALEAYWIDTKFVAQEAGYAAKTSNGHWYATEKGLKAIGKGLQGIVAGLVTQSIVPNASNRLDEPVFVSRLLKQLNHPKAADYFYSVMLERTKRDPRVVIGTMLSHGNYLALAVKN